jgi:hypothetical protein
MVETFAVSCQMFFSYADGYGEHYFTIVAEIRAPL